MTEDSTARLPREIDAVEARVLGALLEKQQATPEYYPLSLNALVAACNQKSNREPVLELSEKEVTAALARLREVVLVWQVGGGRAEKWEHNLDRKLGLTAETRAILTLLLLRGAQTPGEIRTRSERLHPFATLEEAEAALEAMAAEAEPLVAQLTRRPGQKETRWAHLLSGAPVDAAPASGGPPVFVEGFVPHGDRLARLEERLASLERAFAELKAKLGES